MDETPPRVLEISFHRIQQFKTYAWTIALETLDSFYFAGLKTGEESIHRFTIFKDDNSVTFLRFLYTPNPLNPDSRNLDLFYYYIPDGEEGDDIDTSSITVHKMKISLADFKL